VAGRNVTLRTARWRDRAIYRGLFFRQWQPYAAKYYAGTAIIGREIRPAAALNPTKFITILRSGFLLSPAQLLIFTTS